MERIPILRMGSILLVTIQVDMHDRLAMQLQDDLSNKIVSSNARGVLIDISALDIVDSFIGRMLANIASVSRILDAATVLVGMQPAVAITPVELGFSLVDVTKMVTAASELARNTVIYGGGGTVRFDRIEEAGRRSLRLT